ncbi:cytochrome P450 6k1-like isoform X3 [Agrilus planipennis]|uniref:Cytochrome P450 6k1-like isoform X3 n=1 Tax=Agrilus planipennis TaxID=224129 RepID=A0A7F5QZ47_AGRPL|nr:cytochrome P450 6k1-like isoform X3 [Agrilus planipennis]
MHSLLLLCITFYVIYKYLTRNFDYWEQKNVPYIRPKPFFGNICEVFFFRKQFAVQIAELYHQIQDRMVGIFILNQPFLIVKDPEIIKHVLVKDFDIFRNRSIYSNENIDSLSANFMFFAEANKWKILRTKASPIFTSGKLKNMYGTVGSIVKKFVNYLTEETVKTPILDAREVCARYSMDVVATTNFGVDAACLKDKNADFYLIGRRMFDFSYENTIRQAAYFVAPFFIKFAKLQTFDRHVYNYIKHLTTSQINFREENDNYRNGDIIDILVEFKRRKVINDMIFENNFLFGQVGQVFFAGFEPLTVALSFGLYELALNPEIQNRIKTEIISALQEHEKIDYEVTRNGLPYLDQVIKGTNLTKTFYIQE